MNDIINTKKLTDSNNINNNFNNSNICNICKRNKVEIDVRFINKTNKEFKQFIAKHNKKEELYDFIKMCSCGYSVHKVCLLVNIIFNFDLKCPTCQTIYNIKIDFLEFFYLLQIVNYSYYLILR